MAHRLDTLSFVISFISENLISQLDSTQGPAFARLLCKPITSGVLNHILVPSLPSSYDHLPPFISLVKSAVKFEQTVLVGILGTDSSDLPLRQWADNAGAHYERHRRVQILERTRKVIEDCDFANEFVVEVSVPMTIMVEDEEEKVLGVEAVQGDEWGFEEEKGWGFDEDLGESSKGAVALPQKQEKIEEDSWGFDDEMIEEDLEPTPAPMPASPAKAKVVPAEEDGAWGFDDDMGSSPTADNAWDDDPWGAEPKSAPPAREPTLPPPVVVSNVKQATGLAKFNNKGKKSKLNGDTSSTPASPHPNGHFLTPPMSSTQSPLTSHHAPLDNAASSSSVPPPPQPPKKQLKAVNVTNVETYAASSLVKELMILVEDLLAESEQFASSNLFPPLSTGSSSASPPGELLRGCVPAPIDLFRGLYPVKHSLKLANSSAKAMRFSNDCFYLAQQLETVASVLPNEKVTACQKQAQLLADSWYEGTIVSSFLATQTHFCADGLLANSQEKYCDEVDGILAEAEGFTITAEQERYDECESAVNSSLQLIRRLASSWKVISLLQPRCAHLTRYLCSPF